MSDTIPAGLRATVLEQATELDHLRAEVNRLRAERDAAEAKLSAVACTKVWTNEDGKKFVFADDLATALGVPTT